LAADIAFAAELEALTRRACRGEWDAREKLLEQAACVGLDKRVVERIAQHSIGDCDAQEELHFLAAEIAFDGMAMRLMERACGGDDTALARLLRLAGRVWLDQNALSAVEAARANRRKAYDDALLRARDVSQEWAIEQLWPLAANGEEWARSALLYKMNDRILKLVKAMGPDQGLDPQAVADVAQNVWLKLGGFEAEDFRRVDTPRSYVARVVWTTIANYQRRDIPIQQNEITTETAVGNTDGAGEALILGQLLGDEAPGPDRIHELRDLVRWIGELANGAKSKERVLVLRLYVQNVLTLGKPDYRVIIDTVKRETGRTINQYTVATWIRRFKQDIKSAC
jgi:hypothetical protein